MEVPKNRSYIKDERESEDLIEEKLNLAITNLLKSETKTLNTDSHGFQGPKESPKTAT